jgi:hypothetical protein
MQLSGRLHAPVGKGTRTRAPSAWDCGWAPVDVCTKTLNENTRTHTRTHARTRTYTYKLEVNNKHYNLTPPETSSHPQPCPVLLLKPDGFLSQDMCFFSFCLLQLQTAVRIRHCVKSLKVNNKNTEDRLNNIWNASSCFEREHCTANMMTSRSMFCVSINRVQCNSYKKLINTFCRGKKGAQFLNEKPGRKYSCYCALKYGESKKDEKSWICSVNNWQQLCVETKRTFKFMCIFWSATQTEMFL